MVYNVKIGKDRLKFLESIDSKNLTVSMGSGIIKMIQKAETKRKESKDEILTFLAKLKYSIKSGSVKLNFQKERNVDHGRNKKYTNRYTIGLLFPDEDEIEALKRELSHLMVEEYIETVKDTRFPERSEMRVFGKQYFGDDVYIKLRVELMSIAHSTGDNFILVMSFHFSEWDFKEVDFPFRKNRGELNEYNN